MQTHSTLTLALTLAMVGSSARAEPENRSAQKILSPYFLVEGERPGVEAFPLQATRVVANVSGVIADVTVTQIYENHGAGPIHAQYVFPGGTRAAIHGMRIRIGDKTVVARIKERQQAAQEFAEAKAAGKSASLLQQERPNVFTMAVANILPGDHVEVELRYSEFLIPEQGVYSFAYPLVVGPRYSHTPEVSAPDDTRWVKSPYLHEGQRSLATVGIKVNLSTGVPLADLHSPSHLPAIAWENPSLARVSLDRDAGDRDFILEYRLSGKQIESGLLVHEGSAENFFLLTVQPPARVEAADIPPREYIFVLDVSGSMHGFPLDTAKRVMERLIGSLKPTDTFNVVLFSGGSRLLAPSSLAANSQNVAQALAVISRETGGGGTELEAALGTAIGLPRVAPVSRTIVVVTDGYIAEERSAFTLIAEHLHDTNLFAFGIGSSVNRYLIEGLARAGQGEPFVVTGADDAPAVGERFRRYIESPVMTNVRVEFQGFDAYQVEPAAQPDLFAERPIVLYGKWRGPKRGQIHVVGKTATGAFTKTFDVKDSVARPEHATLPQLWARARIARLSLFNYQRDDAEAVREVTTIGLTYSLLTRYTSFIAVLEQVRNPGRQGTDVKQPLPLPAGVSDLAVGGEYGSGAEPGFWGLVLGTALLIAFVARRRVMSC